MAYYKLSPYYPSPFSHLFFNGHFLAKCPSVPQRQHPNVFRSERFLSFSGQCRATCPFLLQRQQHSIPSGIFAYIPTYPHSTLRFLHSYFFMVTSYLYFS